eukprot:1945932-Prymnesium_polylepis.1
MGKAAVCAPSIRVIGHIQALRHTKNPFWSPWMTTGRDHRSMISCLWLDTSRSEISGIRHPTRRCGMWHLHGISR